MDGWMGAGMGIGMVGRNGWYVMCHYFYFIFVLVEKFFEFILLQVIV